jgi:GTP-binding protein
MKPIVALIGRPNSGKSTLFNRVTRSTAALVDDFPGVTRDRHFGDASWNEVEFTLVDTGGFSYDHKDPFSEKIRVQVQIAISDADAVVMLLDGKYGLSPFDQEMVQLLRKHKKPIFYVVNKIDGETKEAELPEFYALGIDALYPISAAHGYGVPDFLDMLVAVLPKSYAQKEENKINVAVVGRPNAGKSSLINRILGEDRLVVSDIPGTTRDAVDSLIKMDGSTYTMVDTAGIRRKGKVSVKLEKFSIIKALRSLDRCDVALIVIDAEDGITEQDIRVAGYAHDRGCGILFLLNKWDLVKKETRTLDQYQTRLKEMAKFVSFAPILTISAQTGQRVRRIFKLVNEIHHQYTTRISTGQINRIVDDAVKRTEPSLYKGKRIRFYYTTQASTKPPTFICFANYPNAVHFSYRRYLVNRIRKETGLSKTPLRLWFRQRTSKEMNFLKSKPKTRMRSKKRHQKK